MAVLNIVNTYEEVKGKLELTPSNNGDFIKLYFTKDGHIITHGVDFIPWGNGTIPIDRLPVDNTKTDSSYLWDSKTISDKINDSFVANSAMRFKGTIGLVSGSTTKYTINGTEATFPSSTAQVGDTYRVTSTGTYANQKCEVGDLLICITAGSSSTAATWTVAQTNINGYVSNKVNNVVRTAYSNDSEGYTIFAPTTSGSNNQILISGGADKTPVWQNPSAITVGAANKVIGTLSTTGNGLKMSSNYNGSANVTIQLLAATTSALGGVKIDSGEKPTISVDSEGKIYLTATNVRNALGYDPVGVNNWRTIKVNGTDTLGSATNTGALDLSNGPGVNVSYDTNQKKVIFSANTNYTTNGKNYKVEVDATSNGLFVNVPWANTTYGVVSNTAAGLAPKVINTQTAQINASYYLLASSNGQATPSWYKLPATAFANTWRDIKINDTSIGSNTLNLKAGSKISLSNSNGTVTIASSWRDIKVGGTSIGDKTLNFMPSGDIYVKMADQDAESKDEFDIGFGLAWFNVSTGEYEYE